MTSENQAKRRQQIINYIKNSDHPVKSSEICSAFDLSRSSLSDDVNAINEQRQIIQTPKRGYYTISENLEDSLLVKEEITKKHIRRWLILAILSDKEQCFDDLLGMLNETWNPCNKNTLYNDLKKLQEEHLVQKERFHNQVYYRSHAIYFTGRNEIQDYLKFRNKKHFTDKVEIKSYESIDHKIDSLLVDDDRFNSSSNSVRRVGKYNILTTEQLDSLYHFCSFPYKNNALEFQFTTKHGDILKCQFSTGMIVYSIETNRIYLFGEDGRKQLSVIPLDNVLPHSIRVCPKKHNYCNTVLFRQIYEEMFNISIADPVTVRVRFQNLPFIKSKIERLRQARKLSTLKISNNGKELLYSDTIRGIEDFARYLRRFGRSAIVEEPQELRVMMINTSKQIMSLYEEDFSNDIH